MSGPDSVSSPSSSPLPLSSALTSPSTSSTDQVAAKSGGRKWVYLGIAFALGSVAAISAVAMTALFFPPVAAAVGITGGAFIGAQAALAATMLVAGIGAYLFVQISKNKPVDQRAKDIEVVLKEVKRRGRDVNEYRPLIESGYDGGERDLENLICNASYRLAKEANDRHKKLFGK